METVATANGPGNPLLEPAEARVRDELLDAVLRRDAAVGDLHVVSPVLRGASEQTKLDYARMYAGTRQVLPACGDHPRPNALHLLFHALFAVNVCLAFTIGLRGI